MKEYTKEFLSYVATVIELKNGKLTLRGNFTIRINGVAIFADNVIFDTYETLTFVEVRNNNTMISLYEYDNETKEII